MELKIDKSLLPQDLFLISTSNNKWIGIKKPIIEESDGGSDVSKGCRVRPEMILGTFENFGQSESHYLVEYSPKSDEEVANAFKRITALDELTYPLKRLKEGKEISLPLLFWDGMTNFLLRLDKDETILRNVVSAFLKNHLRSESVVYDPACSTGTFLQHLSNCYKGIYTIGQDASENMVRVAKERVDEVHLGDSLFPACPAGTADVVICRHLNFDVVTTEIAERLFISALGALKIGGVMIIIGHTPILIDSFRMEQEKLKVINRVGFSPTHGEIFQLYAMIKG